MGKLILNYKEIQSTNREAERLIFDGSIVENAFLVTEYQSDGKGRMRNKWYSEPGKNLLMSWIVFHEVLSVSSQFLLSKAVSLAIIDVLDEYTIRCSIKWPNDIVCHSKKLGGILIENNIMGSRIRHSIAGIGLNVNQLEFPAFPYEASSMKGITGKTYSVKLVRDQLIAALDKRLSQIHPEDSSRIDEDYLKHLYRMNAKAEFICEGHEFEGILRGVDELGQILVESAEGIKSYGFHEIKMNY